MKRLALIAVLLSFCSASLGQTYADVIGYASVEGHWKLQDDAASTTVVNEAGTDAAIATVATNSEDWSVDTGPTSWLPKAFNFPGANQIDLGETITLTGESTISFWANKDTTSTMAVIAQLSANKVQLEGTSVRVTVDSSGAADTATVTMNGEWHHYAFVIKNGEYDVYFDGVLGLDGVTGTAATPFSMPLDRLSCVSTGISPFDGRMAEIIVHSEALDINEINALYDGPTGDPNPLTPTLPGGTPDPLKRILP